ncbi:MAG: tRNA pseudouridine(55) synthase TruB [Gemmatimonadaceae bacterium]
MRAISTDAFLLVDKPAGLTSHDVVAIVRRALGTRKVGHSGTLDPFATGLLVLLAGRGTRLIRFVPDDPKEYQAVIRFGRETDTDDGTGQETRTAAPPPPELVRESLAALTGSLSQVPPAYSAKHVNGQRAYALARRGDAPDLPPVPVVVHGWDVVAQDADSLTARVSCRAGTYIRALARDLGRLCHSAAHLEALRRTRIGPFSVDDADTIERLREGGARPQPLRLALGDIIEQVVDPEDARRVAHGMRIAATLPGERAALLDEQGELIAIAVRAGDEWQPDVVLGSA